MMRHLPLKVRDKPPSNVSFFSRIKIPHVFVLLTTVIFVCSVLTYIIPSGTYTREDRLIGTTTRTVVIPGTYESLPKHLSLKGVFFGDTEEGHASPSSVLGFLTAIPRGMEDVADIIFFIFIVGGVFGILERTGTIAAVLQRLLRKFANSGALLTIILVTCLAIGGSTLGMGEEFIPLIPIFVLVANELGYDRVYGVAIVILGAEVGFSSATTNPFTVQIAQSIAEVPLGSGMPLRLIFFACALVISLAYLLRYGRKIKRDPARSILGKAGFHYEEHEIRHTQMRPAHVYIVLSCVVIFAFIIYATQQLGWWLAELSGGFLLMAIVSGAISRLPVSELAKAFVHGMETMVVGALVVGFAKGIQVVLADGQIMDSLIYYAANVLQNFPRTVAAEGMLLFQTCLNLFIPSGSGQAAVTMPLMAPLADVLGVTRQTAVLAFTCGDGFSNTLVPTSGVLMAMLGLGDIPYEKWIRFMIPLFLQLIVLSGIFLAIAVLINYS